MVTCTQHLQSTAGKKANGTCARTRMRSRVRENTHTHTHTRTRTHARMHAHTCVCACVYTHTHTSTTCTHTCTHTHTSYKEPGVIRPQLKKESYCLKSKRTCFYQQILTAGSAGCPCMTCCHHATGPKECRKISLITTSSIQHLLAPTTSAASCCFIHTHFCVTLAPHSPQRRSPFSNPRFSSKHDLLPVTCSFTVL